MYFLRLKPMDLCSLVEVGGLEAWISDGSCDDINNNALCQFDGGDCCGANVRKQHCMDCQCLGNTILGTFSYFYIYTFHAEILFRISFDIHNEYLSIKSYNHRFLDFKCSTMEDCNWRGICDEFGTCQCIVNWDWSQDCSGKFLLCLQNMQKVLNFILF